MERDEQNRSVYEQILEVLEQALDRLERPPAEGQHAHDPQRAGIFSLGVAGGLAFAGLLPGIRSEALFDDISDAAEQRDLDQLGRIRRTVSARLGLDRRRNVPSPARGDLDWKAGALQMLAVLKEVRTAREEGDLVRYSLMAGFLVGCLSEISWGKTVRYRQGSLQAAVLAAHDRNPERAGAWVKAESITARGGRPPGRGAENEQPPVLQPPRRDGGSTPVTRGRAKGVLRQRGNLHSPRPEFRQEDHRPRGRGHLGSQELCPEPCPRARISHGRPPGHRRQET